MARTGAIARGGSAELGPREMMVSMVIDIDEVETDDSMRNALKSLKREV
jgi:hypothetical protein